MQHLVLCCCYCLCGLKILFMYTCVMNITQKLNNKTHLNAVIVLIFFTSHKIFSCISMSSLACAKFFF